MPKDLPEASEGVPVRATDYASLRSAIIARRHALGLTQADVDYIAGLQDGYCGKLECGVKNFGPLSLGLVLQALGLELVVVATDARIIEPAG
jgi:hypothetical protein